MVSVVSCEELSRSNLKETAYVRTVRKVSPSSLCLHVDAKKDLFLTRCSYRRLEVCFVPVCGKPVSAYLSQLPVMLDDGCQMLSLRPPNSEHQISLRLLR